MKALITSIFITLLCITACTKEHYDNSVKEFFAKGQIGDESDAALLRKSSLTGNWDNIATFHGMISPSDMDMCQTVVNEFRQKYPEVEYTCSPLI
jgi:hypothetical protein